MHIKVHLFRALPSSLPVRRLPHLLSWERSCWSGLPQCMAAPHGVGNQGLLWLVALGLVGSFVSLYYYLLVLKAIFVDEPSIAAAPSVDGIGILSEIVQQATVSLLAAAVVLLGVMPNVLASQILAATP